MTGGEAVLALAALLIVAAGVTGGIVAASWLIGRMRGGH